MGPRRDPPRPARRHQGRLNVKLRRLGDAGPLVSAIGLGAGSTTTDFGARDDAVQVATMQRAIDLGVTFFDTADRYMHGRHERLLSRAIKGRRNQVTIASKFGNFDLPDGKKGYNGRPDFVPTACEATLKQLSAVFKPGAGAGERYTPGYFSTLGA